MQTIESLLKQLSNEFPDLSFHGDELFRWDPKLKTVFYNQSQENAISYLLHETGHAALKHNTYSRDIELIAMERDAWQYAKTVLAPRLDLTVPARIIEDSMDTYREWLHSRSTCPSCNANGIQTEGNKYTCVACLKSWSVNLATGCQLKRYTKKHLA